MFKGKKTCEVLRAVRKRVADLNGIQYVPVECTHEGDCIGTCPACERERQYVEEQLSLRAMAGHTLKVVGVAAGLTSMLSGQEVQAQEMMQEKDTVQKRFEWDCHSFDYFGRGPKPEDMVQWEEMAAFISRFPEDTFLVVGHTDERGSEKFRLKLSEEKAKYFRQLLVERGADPQRIKSVGAGSTECVVPNAKTEPEHEQNRRTTLEFYTPEREKEIREETVILPKFEWNSYCFDFGGLGPKPEDMVQWDEMATFISKFPEDTFLVVGHTDERGSKAYNLRISEARAKFLHKLLVERGVDSLRIKSIGAGPTECVKPNAQTEAEHEQNRRVTLEFYTPERVEAIKRKIEPSTPLEGVKPIKGKYERKKFIRKKRKR